MRPPRRPVSPGHQSGAVMIFALLILTVGALVLGGIVQKAATQNVSSQWEQELAERRIMLRNSRALARQFVLARMFYGFMPMPPDGGDDAFDARFTNSSLGGFSITNTNESIDFWQTVSEAGVAANVNPFSPLERGGFYRVILPAELWDGSTNTDNTTAWNYLVRSRSPIAAGYSLVLQKPASTPSSAVTFENNPYINLIGAPVWVGFPGMPVIPVASVTNTNTDATGYEGYLDVPLAILDADTFPEAGVTWTNNGSGWICDVDLSYTNTNPSDLPPAAYQYDVPASRPAGGTNTNDLPVVAVYLRGADGSEDSTLPPLQLKMTNSPDVASLVLWGANNRSLYVNRRSQTNELTVVMTDATSWRMGITVQDTPVTLFAPGQVTWKGGLRTDTAISVDAASLVVTNDDDPGNLDVIGDRVMWLEDSRK